MQQINIVDFDQTLIPFDSFRNYIKKFLLKLNFSSLKILLYCILRKTNLVNMARFKQFVVLEARKSNNYKLEMRQFADELLKAVDSEVVMLLKTYSKKNTKNILCTASPVDYMALVSRSLNWKFIASEISDKNIVHIYGKQKKEAVLKKYPKEKFQYNFAISDNINDLSLLRQFKHYKIIKKS